MKKIVFVIKNLSIGGSRKSLVNLMNSLDKTEFDIYLLLFSHKGEYLNQLNSNIKLLPENNILKAITGDYTKKNTLLTIYYKIIKIAFSISRRTIGYPKTCAIFLKTALSKINRKNSFDVAIGYQEGISNDLSYYLKSKKHYYWIHSNYDKFSKTNRGLSKTYKTATYIIFVSEYSKAVFKKFIPEVAENKLIVIKNLVPDKEIIDMSNKDDDVKHLFSDNTYTYIVSVGRLSKEKGFDKIPEISEYLVKKSTRFKWFIVGDGLEKELIEKKIISYNLCEHIFMLGSQQNPYKFMKHADFIVITSDYEAQPLVVIESLIMGKYVVSTEFDSLKEFDDYAKDRIFVTNHTSQNIAEVILKLTTSFNLLKSFEYNYNSEQIIYQFVALIQESGG